MTIYIIDPHQPFVAQVTAAYLALGGGILQYKGEQCIVAPCLLKGWSRTFWRAAA